MEVAASRTPVLPTVLRILMDAPASDHGRPRSYSVTELALIVYGTVEPTPAQTSAIRRAIAVLTRRGQATVIRHHRNALVARRT